MGHGQNEEDVILPSHKAKIGDKFGRCQQCMASWRLGLMIGHKE